MNPQTKRNQEMAAQKANGWPLAEIARQHGLSRPRVREIVGGVGADRSAIETFWKNTDRVSRMWGEGRPFREMAREIGISNSAFRRICRQIGLPPPPPWSTPA